MNGNFEVNKAVYPYAATRVGESIRILHMPTLNEVYSNNLPREVAEDIAGHLNVLYWGEMGQSLREAVKNIRSLVVSFAYAAYTDGRLTGSVYDQIKLQAEEQG